MIEDETEALVRETFRSREHLVAGAGHVDLLAKIEPAKRASGPAGLGVVPVGSHRARLMVATIALIAIATVGAVVLATTGGPGRAPGRGGTGPAAGGDAPEGWVWYSSLGMEIAVPADWVVNDTGCNQSDRPTVARGRGAETQCLTPEPPTKRIAEISAVPDPSPPDSERLGIVVDVTTTEITIDGVPAVRTTGAVADGRYAAVLTVPSRQVYLLVRTTDQGERDQILDTVRLVDVDRLGCATERPPVTAPADPAASLLPETTESVRVCFYGVGPDRPLAASAELGATDADWFVHAVDSAPAGRNPDAPPDQCIDTGEVVPDAVLLFIEPDGSVARLWMTFSTCTERGLDNGARQAHVSADMVVRLSAILHSGLGYDGTLNFTN